jgi:Protein of unknown function (DUF3800)
MNRLDCADLLLSFFPATSNHPYMPNKFIFADEAGCFTFTREANVSRYFILCTVTMDDCAIGADLLRLRRRLAWEGAELGDYFHATEDKQAVRDRVFGMIGRREFSIQATIMEKSKAQAQVKVTKPLFYQYGFYYHFKHSIHKLLKFDSETLVTAASLGTRKERAAFENAVSSVLAQTHRPRRWKADFMPCHADPCLQVADYCAWAIQRRWERGDSRSYDLIRNKITYEYDLWSHGNTHYY